MPLPKPEPDEAQDAFVSVAPRAGAWIETD
jgi:hypothetical protein